MRRSEMVWILEDDEGTIFVLEEILGIHYELIIFRTIAEFTEHLEKNNPNPQLIIADLKLRDGYFTDYLSAQEKLNHSFDFPFLVISSIDDPTALRFCFNKGALDYLIKPFKKNELLVKVERLIANHKVSEAAAEGTRFEKLTPITKLKLEELLPLLTMKENLILSAFLESVNFSVTKAELHQKGWMKTAVSPKSLDVHLSHLRKKLKPLRVRIVSIEDGVWELQQMG